MGDFEDFLSFEALQLLANNSVSSATFSQTTTPIAQGDEWTVAPAPRQENQSTGNYADATPQARGPVLVNDISRADPFTQTQRQRKRRKPLDAIPGYSIIESTEAQGPKSKCSKFQPERKKEVAKIRMIGACLRCRQLKISVSHLVSRFLVLNSPTPL